MKNALTSPLFILLLLLLGNTAYGQTVFKGVVQDAETQLVIPDAKIGINHQGVGVMSASNGRFAYKKYHQVLDDSSILTVSAPGYETIQLEAKEIRALLNIPSIFQLKKADAPQKVIGNKVKVFWDISEGMQDRDLDKELAFLSRYLDGVSNAQVQIEVFNDQLDVVVPWTAWDGDVSRFPAYRQAWRESVTAKTYNGPSNYSLLKTGKADRALLFSNGDPNFGELEVTQELPITGVTTIQTTIGISYLKNLARYTNGTFVPLWMEQNKPLVAEQIVEVEEKKIGKSPITTGPLIQGKVTSLNQPLQGASIHIKGTLKEYSTEADGSFTIPAKDGDILLFRYLGMFPKDVLITKGKEIVVELLPKNDVLKEVVLTSKYKNVIVGKKEMRGTTVPHAPGGVTALGDFFITSEDITPNGLTLEQLLRNMFSGVTLSNTPYGPIILIKGKAPNAWVVNGIKLGPGEPPPFYLADKDIESIVVKESSFLTSRYGPDILGLAVIVTTKSAPLAKAKYFNSALVKGNDYVDKVPNINVVSKITGTIFTSSGPIQGATINRSGSFDEYTTKANGSFEMLGTTGDVFLVHYLGMYSKGFEIVENTTNYDIELIAKNDVLDEVVLQGGSQKNETIQTVNGEVNKDKLGYDVKVLRKADIPQGKPDIASVLNGRFAGIRAVEDPRNGLIVLGRWGAAMLIVIDGNLFIPDAPKPWIPPSNVESITVYKSGIGTLRYGSLGKNGVVEIETINFSSSPDAAPKSMLVEGNEYTEEIQTLDTPISDGLQTIQGTVANAKGPLKDAAISLKGTFNEVMTDAKGSYAITAKMDDVLIINKAGYYPKEVLVESQQIPNVKLTSKNQELDEVIVAGSKRVDNTVETAYGETNEDQVGTSTKTISKNSFSNGATSLRQLITGKVAGVDVAGGLYSGSEVVYKIRGGSQSINTEVPPIWIVNGTPYQDPPEFLDVQQIESISVLKSVSATSRYGSMAAGGAFLIKTSDATFKEKAKKAQRSALVTGNEYVANSKEGLDASLPAYIVRFRESGLLEKQFELYQKLSRTQESPLEFYVDAAKYFSTLDKKLGEEVRADLAYISRNNTKALRTLAYVYDTRGDTKNMVLVNERIAKIAPQEAQSYRDLALAYQQNGQYNKALELYINMLGEQIKGVNFDGLEKPLRNELSNLVALHKDKIDYNRLPNEWLRTDYNIDIRMVVEWSDRTVPFEFQFVNPEKKFFKWSHTLEDNRERLKAEQLQGFQMEEFIIDDATPGEWLINIQYLGDESDYVLPPFLKYTVFKNYGTPQETREIKVVKLFKQLDKVTLGKVTL